VSDVTDRPQRIIAAFRELDGRLWPDVLVTVLNDLLTTANFSRTMLLDYLRENVRVRPAPDDRDE
jgi:hypothetical protein